MSLNAASGSAGVAAQNRLRIVPPLAPGHDDAAGAFVQALDISPVTPASSAIDETDTSSVAVTQRLQLEPSVDNLTFQLTPPPASDHYHGQVTASVVGSSGSQTIIVNLPAPRSHSDGGLSSAVPSLGHMSTSTHTSTAATSLAVTMRESRCESASDTYARILFAKRFGYPLWTPEPRSTSAGYEEEGIRIGDVGIIDQDGQFEYFFNVCLPADHPTNRRSPPSMIPFTFDPDDVKRNNNYFAPNTIIQSQSIQHSLVNYQAQLPSSRNTHPEFHFRCPPPDGAILLLPNGASRTNLQFRNELQKYAARHLLSWYEYVYRERGLEVEAGPLYLVTGYDKCDNWCLASYVNIPADLQLSLSFTPTALSSNRTVTYSSRSSGAISTRTFTPRTTGTNFQNQKYLWDQFASMTSLLQFPDVTSKGASAKRSSAIHRFLSQVTGRNVQQMSAATTSQQGHPGVADSSFESLPDIAEPYHPLNVINTSLLQQMPEAQFSITHDDEFCSVMRETDGAVPDDQELLHRIFEQYHPTLQDGCVSLTSRGAQSIQNVHTLSAQHHHSGQTVKSVAQTPETGMSQCHPSPDFGQQHVNMPVVCASPAADRTLFSQHAPQQDQERKPTNALHESNQFGQTHHAGQSSADPEMESWDGYHDAGPVLAPQQSQHSPASIGMHELYHKARSRIDRLLRVQHHNHFPLSPGQSPPVSPPSSESRSSLEDSTTLPTPAALASISRHPSLSDSDMTSGLSTFLFHETPYIYAGPGANFPPVEWTSSGGEN